MISKIIYNISNIKKQIGDVVLVVVSKTVETSKMKIAFDSGCNIFGENKVHEAKEKYDEMKEYALSKNKEVFFHLIGHLQSNKVKTAVQIFDVIQSVDSIDLLKKINKNAKDSNKIQKIFIQLNVSLEATKFGVNKNDIYSFFDEILTLDLSNIFISGLMTIGPNTEDKNKINECFKEMSEIYGKIQKKYLNYNIDLNYLSMGMSQDYLEAIKNKANMIRLGSSIFGERI